MDYINIKYNIYLMNLDNAFKQYKNHIHINMPETAFDSRLWSIELFEDYLAHYSDLTKTKPDPEMEEAVLVGEISELTEKEINDFLHVFAIKKIASTSDELQSYLDTLRDFLSFLRKKSLIEEEKIKSLSRVIDEAKDLPLTASAAEALFELARSFPDKEYSELVSGFFTVTQINSNDAELKEPITEKKYSPVLLSPKIMENIRIGMILHLEIVNTDKGWEVVEAGNVYLKLST